jgi:programmed cell death protein 4
VRSFEKLFCTWEDISLDVPRAPQALLVMLRGCVEGGAVKRNLLTKIPENLLNAGLQQAEAETEVTEMLIGVQTELKNFKKEVTRCLEEYFVALSAAEVETFLTEKNMQPYQHEFVKKAITLSFIQTNLESARGALLDLFSHLSRSCVLSKDDLQWGVTRLLGQLDDLALDCPKCVDYSVETCSCMVADELLSVPFLRRCRLLRIGGATGLQVIDRIQRRTPEYSKRHLNTAQFKKELQTIILEYFNSGDKAEVGRCISELSPLSDSQSAEIIRKVMVLAMERSGAECELALNLIIWLVRQEELDADAVEAGFDEMYQRMEDTVLDVPDVHDMALSFVVEAKKARVLPANWEPPPSE